MASDNDWLVPLLTLGTVAGIGSATNASAQRDAARQESARRLAVITQQDGAIRNIAAALEAKTSALNTSRLDSENLRSQIKALEKQRDGAQGALIGKSMELGIEIARRERVETQLAAEQQRVRELEARVSELESRSAEGDRGADGEA